MNMINLSCNGFTVRFFAMVTITAMLISALPVAFFISFASTGVNGDSFTINVDNPSYSATANTSGLDTIQLSFEYDISKLDGDDDNVLITYSAGTVNGSVLVNGTSGDGLVATDQDLVTLPGVEANPSLPVSITVDTTGFSGVTSDFVTLSNITITGTAIPLPPAGTVWNETQDVYYATLNEAVDAAGAADVIKLTADILVEDEVVIDEQMIIDGQGFVITTNVDFESNSDDNSIIEIIDVADVSITDVVIEGAGGSDIHGINIYEATGVQLSNIEINDNDKSGIVVNSSEAEVFNLTTAGNGWNAINVDKQTSEDASLRISGNSQHAETTSFGLPGFVAHIFVDAEADELNGDVTVHDDENQYDRIVTPTDAVAYVLKTEPDVENVSPTFQCWVDNGDETATGYFGYFNRNDFPVTIPIGDDNKVNGSLAPDAGQPTEFAAGKTSFVDDGGVFKPENAAFAVTYPITGSITWTLDGSTATAGTPDNKLCPDPEPEPAPQVCSFAGTATLTQGDRNNGTGVPVDRSDVAAVTAGVAAYANFGGKEGADWQVTPLDFVSLGIGGTFIYEFTDKVAVDGTGADIAIWEITGGNQSEQTNESADVYLSENGVDYELAGTVIGDGTVDIATTNLDFAKFVKLVDTSTGVQGGNGDGFDLDAITIIDGSCDDFVSIDTTKIVCDSEAELPNWGGRSGADIITDQTAQTWLQENENTSCREVQDWEFEWAPRSASNPGNDFVGAAGNNWTTFSNVTFVPLRALDNQNSFWMREVLPEDYIPFVGGQNNDVSAELYCHSDGLNYDNYDRIDNPTAGETYHCVAWNVPKELPPQQCSLFSDTGTVVKETNQFAIPAYVHDSWTEDIDDATWVWNTEYVENPEDDATYTFVETFVVEDPVTAVLEVAADNTLLVRLNGETILDRTNQNNFVMPRTIDLLATGELLDGENTIEFVVTNNARNGSNKFTNPAGVLYRIDIESPEACVVTTEPIDDVPPVIEVTTPANNITVDSDFTIEVVATDDIAIASVVINVKDDTGANLFSCLNETLESPIATHTSSCLLEITSLADGQYSFKTNARDTAGNISNTVTQNFTIDRSTPENPEMYTISGFKWDDENANGEFDGQFSEVETEREKAIQGWTINLEQDGQVVATAITDKTGAYSFNVEAGNWTITEETREGWVQTGLYQNNQVVSSDTAAFDRCTFTIPEQADQVEFYTCSFGNNKTTDPEQPPVNNPETSSRSSSGGGTRIERVPAPMPLVLGATTDAVQFCPFLIDHMQMGWENDRTEVMKLQLFLNVFQDTFGGSENPVTGTYGLITEANVKAFQEAHRAEVLDPWYDRGIVPHNNPTGFVYKTTLWKINDIVCPNYAQTPTFEGETLETNVKIDVAPVAD